MIDKPEIGIRDGETITANYRLDINTDTDVRNDIELSGLAKSPPANHEQSNPKKGFKRVVWAETSTVKDELVDYLDGENIEYAVVDFIPTLYEAKKSKIDEIKEKAQNLLSKTDWYVVRKQETNESIPEEVVNHRSKVRSLSDKFESDVEDLTTVKEVQRYQFDYPEPPQL